MTKEKEQEIINYYILGNSSIKCAEKFSVCSQTVLNLLKKYNITFRCPKRRLDFFNQDFFEVIDSEAKAYFLGLIVADGNVYNSSLRIALQEEDCYILEMFLKYTKSTSTLKIIRKSSAKPHHKLLYRLSLTSKKLVYDLGKLGVIPAKSHYTYFPPIEEQYWSHFIRGVFDGDGSIFKNMGKNSERYRIAFMGNVTLMEKIQEILMKECGLDRTKMYKQACQKPNILMLSYGGNSQLKKIREYLYKDATIYLKRKKEKFDKVKDFKDKKCYICGEPHRGLGLCTKHYNKLYYDRIFRKN